MADDVKYDSTHKYWEDAVKEVETAPHLDPSKLCECWDMLENWEAQREEHRARQAAGLEPPDDFLMIQEQMPPVPIEEYQKEAEKLCRMLKESPFDKFQRLGEEIRAVLWDDGRPAHRPPSAYIAARDARIVEQIEYWRAKKRQMKAILPDIGKRYGLSPRAVKEIWDARKRKAT
jgi:hypothetical protein